jgi:ribulose-5-phosphate 4-epimerase/fuculose-1-phosphate aldolase
MSSRAPLNADPALIEDLVAANRILFDQGVVDGFGHVSVRHDKRGDAFLLARNMAPGLVTGADIMAFDFDANPLDDDRRAVYLERFIHAEIYRARPEVAAIVHSHSPSVIPFGIVAGASLRPVFHMAGFLGAATPVFEVRDMDEKSDLLIRTPALGAALARSLGVKPVVLMRGHGATIVGGSVRQAVYRAVYAEVNARLQAAALQLGPVTYLNAAEAEHAAATNDGQVNRPWEVWRSRALGGATG